MEPADSAFFERAYQRLFRMMAALPILGTPVALYRGSWRAGLGFLIGAAFSVANFRWLKQLADALGRKGPPRKMWHAVLFGGRYFLFGAACYVIVKVFGISLLAVLLGLFVAAAAVILEIIYELLYARA